VVVSGAPQEVQINPEQRVDHLMRQALKQAGIDHPNLEEWKLRSGQGGAVIDPDQKIEEAGIQPGQTLFLDPDEGGGGQVAVAPAELPPLPEPPTLVDPEISKAKLVRQLSDWRSQAEEYRKRGWLLLDTGELHVDVGFAAQVPIGSVPDSTAIPLAVRLAFENYDLWPPSIQVIDPLDGRPLLQPRIQALDFEHRDADGTPGTVLLAGHPDTGRPFLCKRGVREYHAHFEHSGDDWLLYRGQGIGTLVQLCEAIWRLTTRTIAGVQVAAQRVPVGEGAQVAFALEYRQDDVDALAAQLEPQMQMQPAAAEVPLAALPPQLQAQLQQIFDGNQT
jgi:hypothetical protein